VIESVAAKYGMQFANSYNSAVRFSITGPPPPETGGEAMAQHLRAGSTISTLGLNPTTWVKQPLGILASVASPQINTVQLLGAIQQAAAHPKESTAFVMSRTHMKDMFQVGAAQGADLSHILTGSPLVEGAKRATMTPIAWTQRLVNIPTWIAAYNTQLNRTGDEAKAIDMADQVIRDTQGTGEETEFTAGHQNAYTRLLATFGGFLITQMNAIGVPVMTIAKNPLAWNPTQAAAWKQFGAQAFFTILMGAFANEAVDAILKGGDLGPEDKESAKQWGWYSAKTMARATLATNPYSRWIADSVERGQLIAPAGLRPVESGVRALAGAYNVALNENAQQKPEDVAAHAIRSVGGFVLLPTGWLARLFTGENGQEMIFGRPNK
jgi:hypothetical protein